MLPGSTASESKKWVEHIKEMISTKAVQTTKFEGVAPSPYSVLFLLVAPVDRFSQGRLLEVQGSQAGYCNVGEQMDGANRKSNILLQEKE